MTKTTRIPKLFCSYLATEMLAPFFASFVIMNCVFFLIKLIPFLNIVLELEINFADFLRLFCYLFPNIFLYSIPMAAMMGVIISFTRLSADAEILAFKASGISLYQMIPPVLLVSFFIALITSYFSVSLIPKAETAMKQLMFQVAKEKIDKGIKEQQFTEALGDLVVHVESINKKSGDWKNVWVSDMRGQINPIITMAQSGNMTANIDNMLVNIVLKNGSLHRPDGERSQIISFDSYTINMPIQPPTVFDGDDVTQMSSGSMTLSQLQESATLLGRDSKYGKKRLLHYHKRLTLPVGCFILSLLGMPLGLLAGPGRKAVGIPLGLAFFIFYYILFTIGKTLAEDTPMPITLAMWLPNIIFFLITLYFIRQSSRERPVIPDAFKDKFSRLLDSASAPFLKKFRKIFPPAKTKSAPEAEPTQLPPRPTSPETLIIKQERPNYLTEGTVHGNVISHIFHVQGCDWYYCKNCTIEFHNITLAEESGFKPCQFCKMLLESASKETPEEGLDI